ncbi:hypothetical protein [Kangiella sp. M94]
MILTIIFLSNGKVFCDPSQVDLSKLSSFKDFCKVLDRSAVIIEEMHNKQVDHYLFFVDDRQIEAAAIKKYFKPEWSWSAGLQVGFFAWILAFIPSALISEYADIPINHSVFGWLAGGISIIAGIWAARNLGGKL